MEQEAAAAHDPRAFWDREEQELQVSAYQRQTHRGTQEVGGYLRTIRKAETTSTCAVCTVIFQSEQYPGPTPRYCSDTCRRIAERQAAAARMRRLRARRHML
jgi:hypothetical protein